MFKADIEIKGKHATFMKSLVEDNNLFTRNIDVYMAAPLVGFVHGRKEEVDVNEPYSEVTRKIATQALLKEEKPLDLIYRLIMLLDNSTELTIDDQVNRAFRDDSNKKSIEKHKENMNLFNSYVRGGISLLYEKIIHEATVKEDYFSNIFEFVKEYSDEIQGITDEETNHELNKII